MDIRIGDYRLVSGPADYIVSKMGVGEDEESKNFGKEVENNKTYHPSLSMACENLLKRRVLESDATTLRELLKSHQEARAELQALFKDTIA
jgi:hypothetical protein